MRKMLVPLIIGAAAMSLTSACSSETAAEQTAELQEESIDAYFAQDLEAQVALVSEDVEFVNETHGDRRIGTAMYESLMRGVYTMTDYDATEVVGQFVSEDGSRGVVVYHWVGARTDGGEPFDLNMVQVHEYEDGEIVKTTVYFANPDAHEQLFG